MTGNRGNGVSRRHVGFAALVVASTLGVLLIGGAAFYVVSPLLASSKASPAPPTPAPRPSSTPTPSGGGSTVAPPPPLKDPLTIRVLYGTQKTGASIVAQLQNAYRGAGLPTPRVAKWTKVRSDTKPVFASAPIGNDSSPESRLKDFARLVNDAPRSSIDVALMEFSYADITADTDIDAVFAGYVATMESLENAHPDVRFLYTTVPVTAENSWKSVPSSEITGLTGATQPVWQDNIARERYNALIRARFAQGGRLFDIAALEADRGKGMVAGKEHEGRWFYVLNPADSKDGRTLTSTAAKRLAGALSALVTSISRT